MAELRTFISVLEVTQLPLWHPFPFLLVSPRFRNLTKPSCSYQWLERRQVRPNICPGTKGLVNVERNLPNKHQASAAEFRHFRLKGMSMRQWRHDRPVSRSHQGLIGSTLQGRRPVRPEVVVCRIQCIDKHKSNLFLSYSTVIKHLQRHCVGPDNP